MGYSRGLTGILASTAALGALLVGTQANATLMLDTTVTADFGHISTNTFGNDTPNAPSQVYFGQLRATSAGAVDFYYVGNEAGYINSLVVGGSTVSSVGPDGFGAPYPIVGSLNVGAGELLDFGLCTSGGDLIAPYGRCAYNDDAASLDAQFNYPADGYGYRSIAFVALTSFNSAVFNSWVYSSPLDGPLSDLWMVLWDDSGARNDDNHDDYVAIARFHPFSVAEPGTLLLLGAGLVGLGLTARRRKRLV